MNERSDRPRDRPGRHTRRGRQDDRRARGRRTAQRARRRALPAHGRSGAGPRRGSRVGRPTGRRDVQQESFHPVDPAVPRPVPLLHVRDHAGAPARPVPVARRGPRHRPQGCRDGLQGSAVHARRPARGPLGRRQGVARGGGLRQHAGVRPRDGHPGARGDRAAASPQPRRHELEGDVAAQAGRAVDGHDAGDHESPAVRGEGRGALRQPRQGSGRTPAGPRGRRPAQHPVHDGAADRHRRDDRRPGREHLRAAPDRAHVRVDPGSHHPELRVQGRHGDAADARPRGRGVPRRDRDDPHPHGPRDARAGAAQPRGPRRLPGPAGCRRRRLRRHQPADTGPRQSRAAVAADHRADRAVR